jgi:2-oxo-4-hydroxy-4-carboxy--5-ureidoimidazoline (OHCU) decarboxylase
MTSTQFHSMLILMKSHGGSFVSAIAEALRFADPINREKLLTAFPDLVEKYGPTSKFTRTLQEVI